ncbi:hypothetical protein [Streptomyces sp. AK08-02]|uniref:hypothetical protein n=1 Tax=Streptomyces sp. AK08-02 TaxID=3028654 RepID=UPI0029A8C22F|nr:hypothetical protein [Streptomyces sp. AK08-02]MDX3745496.1 hypothetical protein [Streptomyces sp. AK08-02]
MTSAEPRADRFVRELTELRISDPAAARSQLWLRLGGALMALSVILGASGYLVTHNTLDPLVQNDGIALGLAGIAAGVVGAALFLRYSLTGFLRFWMARQSYDVSLLAESLREPDRSRDPE